MGALPCACAAVLAVQGVVYAMEGVCSNTPCAHGFYAMRSWRVCRRALLLVWAKVEGTRVRGPLGCRESPLFEAVLLR